MGQDTTSENLTNQSDSALVAAYGEWWGEGVNYARLITGDRDTDDSTRLVAHQVLMFDVVGRLLSDVVDHLARLEQLLTPLAAKAGPLLDGPAAKLTRFAAGFGGRRAS